MHRARNAWRHGNVKTSNVAVGVEWLKRTTYDVGMVLLDKGGTASRCMQIRFVWLSTYDPAPGRLVEFSDLGH